MFDFEGRRSAVSQIVTSLLESSGLPLDCNDAKSLACVVYRSDPSETWNAPLERFPLTYPFITAYAGISQIEPMFGPIVWDDSRRPDGPPSGGPNPLGFQARENTQWYKVYGEDQSWRIYLNGRASKKESGELIERFERQLLPPLTAALTSSSHDVPLFPKLWHQERLARDRMVRAFQEEPPSPDMDRVVDVVTRLLRRVVDNLLPDNINRLGAYLHSGHNWSLAGQNNTVHPLPRTIEAGVADLPDGRDAFNWVNDTTRPVLLRVPISAVWRKRLAGCGSNVLDLTEKPDFKGICIVPLLDLYQQSRSIGTIFFTSSGPHIVAPAHLFLLSRLALSASGYLTPLFPFSGSPWFPELDLGRGASTVTWKGPKSSSRMRGELVQRLAGKLMPTKAEVSIIPIPVGYSGAEVFKLEVLDGSGSKEIPRILKIGPFEIVKNEFLLYRRFVHNKCVGYASRVDAAGCDSDYGAIVYLLVGAGEKAKQWSEWAGNADLKILKDGIDRLYGQLSNWYENRKTASSSSLELLITAPFVTNELTSYIPQADNPSLEEVKALLTRLSKVSTFPNNSKVSVVHGDLHAGNVFSILGQRNELAGVAVIDWGRVSEGRHPLSDIARLMADLHYKVRWTPRARQNRSDERHWAFERVCEWGKRIGLQDPQDNDASVALIHQIAKMLFYTAAMDDTQPYLSPDARVQAWQDLQDLVKAVEGEGRTSRSRRRA